MRRALVVLSLAACGGDGEIVFDAPCAPAAVYLNRAGATYRPGGFDDASRNYTPLVDVERPLAPWPYDDVDWASLVSCIRTALAPLPITVTEIDPELAEHAELVFTTAYWAGPAGTTSIAGGNCTAAHEVAFVFGAALPTYARACHVALRAYAQMTAHLSLADDCEDVLNDEQDCSEWRAFKDMTQTCVDEANAPADCRCGGTTQNSYRALLAATSCPAT